jgi:hypothetical protein
MGLKHFTGTSEEVLQLEIVGASERQAEAFALPFPPPQNVLAEPTRPSADIRKVQQLIGVHQGSLQHICEEELDIKVNISKQQQKDKPYKHFFF